ncbi:DgyrCDS3792 [Dimorphilus gyrociliatus]|uniref:DgyrCDS3792 n=1 Tax=Dimorphilus gyrociliatus TaxID=2664684 RepID=A0A7I8VFJ2_9ANNE|nr:DgyrCDS3792 [Dimorphilus gyrociliatus]
MASEEEKVNIIQLSLDLIEEYEKTPSSSLITDYIDNLLNNPAIDRQILPDFIEEMSWINVTRPIKKEDFAGKLLIVDFFTYCCINCIHILPILKEIEKIWEKENNIQVIGVHSAKFPNEKQSKSVIDAVQRYNIEHPVLNDSEMRLWSEMNISCWPTVVLFSHDLKALLYIFGENHENLLKEFIKIAFNHLQLRHNVTRQIPVKVDYISRKSSDLSYPGKVFVDDEYIMISNSRRNKIIITDHLGSIKHHIGSGLNGDKDGNFQTCSFSNPQGLVRHGNVIFIADTGNNKIRKINLDSGRVTSLPNCKKFGKCSPWDLYLTKDYLVVAMSGIHQLWAYTLNNCVILGENLRENSWCHLCGTGEEGAKNNLYPKSATLAQPSGVTVFNDLIVFADSESSSIRSFSLQNGSVKNIVGGDINPSNLFAFGDIDGKGQKVKLQHPMSVSVSNEKNIIIADSYNNKLKEIDVKERECRTIDIEGLNEPGGLSVYKDQIFIADTNNHCIKIYDKLTKQLEKMELSDGLNNNKRLKLPQKNTRNVNLGSLTVKKNIKMCFNIQLFNHELNKDAPNMWSLTTKGSSKSGTLEHVQQELNIRLDGEDKIDFEMDTLLYLCHEGACELYGLSFTGTLNVLEETGRDSIDLHYSFA